MSSVYSTAFIQSHAGTPDVYVVPDGYRAIIRCCTGFNASGVAPESGSVFLHNSDCTIWACYINPLIPGESGFRQSTDMRVVVEPGDAIDIVTGSDMDITVSGYLLSLP